MERSDIRAFFANMFNTGVPRCIRECVQRKSWGRVLSDELSVLTGLLDWSQRDALEAEINLHAPRLETLLERVERGEQVTSHDFGFL